MTQGVVWRNKKHQDKLSMVNSATRQLTFSPIGLRPQGLNVKIKSGQLTCYKTGQFNLLPTRLLPASFISGIPYNGYFF